MPDTSIDKLSQLIGSVQSDIKHLLHTTSSIEEKVEKLQEKAIEQKMTIETAHTRIDKMYPKVEEHERLKDKGLGVLASVGMAFGVVGAFIGKVIQYIIG